uniref:Nuclear cap-binding protein subunit 3 n=1 Tax=Cyprinus carpio carpio TaxID=630221 RepID=A0A9J8D204_CYPCA
MAAVRSLRVSVKSESASDRSESDSESDSDRDAREAEPMEVEEGELGLESIPVRRSLKELLPDTSRRYENKAGTFITGIDVTSKEAIEKKEKRARRFHFHAEENLAQRNVVVDRDVLKKAIPKVRLEALHMSGLDDMSTQDVFGYFKEYPPAHIEWIDDTSCNVVWLDDITSTRALINLSRMPDKKEVTNTDSSKPSEVSEQPQKARRSRGSDDDDDEEEEEGEVDDDDEDEVVKADKSKSSDGSEGKASDIEEETEKKPQETVETSLLSQAERESLFRNDLRPTVKPFKDNKLFLRFATQDDKKELGAARRSRYYMKYGNPNYGGMKGILSNSWKRRYHTRRIQRDVLKTKKPLIGDSMGHTPPYTHRHSGKALLNNKLTSLSRVFFFLFFLVCQLSSFTFSADLVNLPEEPIEEEEEEEEEVDGEEDMDADDRVVEYRDRADRERGPRLGDGGLRSRLGGPSPASSDSDEMDYDLELKMISTPSPKKSMKMTMYADEVETNLRSLRNSIQTETSSSVKSRIGGGGGGGGSSKSTSDKVTDVRQLLEEKRQGLPQQRSRPPVTTSSKTDVRQRLGKRPHSPERRRSVSPVISRNAVSRREPLTDVRSRLGVAKLESRGLFSESSKDKKTGGLWSRLGPSHRDDTDDDKAASRASSSREIRRRDDEESDGVDDDEEGDSQLQKVWGAMIKQKEQQTSKMKKSRLDNLPSLQIEISRDSSNGSDSDS